MPYKYCTLNELIHYLLHQLSSLCSTLHTSTSTCPSTHGGSVDDRHITLIICVLAVVYINIVQVLHFEHHHCHMGLLLAAQHSLFFPCLPL